MENKLQDIFLTEYETMRSEIRLYINKLYLGLSVITGLITFGVFKDSPEKGGFIYVWIPYIISATIGFMTMVSFFVNKTAGYVRLLEHRLARMYNTTIPSEANLQGRTAFHLAPIFWESFYADYNMKRDVGQTLRSLYFGGIAGMILAGLIMLCIVLNFGYQEAIKWDIIALYRPAAKPPYIITGVAYLISAFLSVASSGFLYWWVGTTNRGKLIEVNKSLLSKLGSDDIRL